MVVIGYRKSKREDLAVAIFLISGAELLKTKPVSCNYISVDTFPTDSTPNRIIYEEHNYTPFQFMLMDGDASWGNMFYYWGEGYHSTMEPGRNPTWGEETEQTAYFDHLKLDFVDQGIPLLFGEYGAHEKGNSSHVPLVFPTYNDAFDYWITFTTKLALERDIKPFYWDTDDIISRKGSTILDQRSLDVIVAGTE